MGNTKNWFALYLKAKQEFKAQEELKILEIQNYLPVIVKVKQWSDRKKKISEPLIRGYIFIYANEKQRLISLERDPVVKCISNHGRPARIPEWQIVNLQNMLNNEADFSVVDGILTGDKVEIKEGPFKGVRGILDKIETGSRLSVSIELLNRSVVVHLPKESVIKTAAV